ncbi:MAG: hypothetical protein RL341_1098, partial [Pseudomonadota bacterium]
IVDVSALFIAMLAARILLIVVALVFVGLMAAYLISGKRQYLRMAVRLGLSVAALLVLFFAVLVFQNWA